jgi:phosphoribosylaminoimidazole (AIR) synthetase
MRLIASAGVATPELRRTFNLGVGMTIVVPEASADAALAALAPWRGRTIGRLVPRAGGEPTRFVGDHA